VVEGLVRTLLRLEGGAVLVGTLWLYGAQGPSWWLFAALFLAPDVAMVGYLAGPRVGAACYNAAHTYLVPATLAGIGTLLDVPVLTTLALIWAAHIGFDRLVGYGLKLPTTFVDTHLGPSGPASRRWQRMGGG
jgi:hypothetical protein